MWLVLITLAAVAATAIWYVNDNARLYYNMGFLNLVLWGTAVMVFVDHVMGYLAEGGEFLEVTPDATMLSIVLLITAIIVWGVVLLLKDSKGLLKNLKM